MSENTSSIEIHQILLHIAKKNPNQVESNGRSVVDRQLAPYATTSTAASCVQLVPSITISKAVQERTAHLRKLQRDNIINECFSQTLKVRDVFHCKRRGMSDYDLAYVDAQGSYTFVSRAKTMYSTVKIPRFIAVAQGKFSQ